MALTPAMLKVGASKQIVLGLHLFNSFLTFCLCIVNSKNMEYCLLGRDATRPDRFSGLCPHANCT